MVALDFVSLLLSKDAPVQASLSISPALREAVSLGTLGADKVQDSRVTKLQKQDNRRIAKGWKLHGLAETVESILASATRLESEIEKETKYWEQVLDVSEKGWAICNLPQERHTLGVRFGFAECLSNPFYLVPLMLTSTVAAPAFNNRSLGALRRNPDGTIYLDQGVADSTPKRVRVRIETNGTNTGESSLPMNATKSQSIESIILRARNTIFEEELWQELNREARTLANQGVRLLGDEIICSMSSTKRIVLDLEHLEDNETSRQPAASNEDDTTAELISLSLHLLLSYAHRQNLRRRSLPPPPLSNRPPPNLPYNLFRPILARLHHQSIVLSIDNLLRPLSKALKSAGAADSSYSMNTALINSTSVAPIRAQLGNLSQSTPEGIIDSLITNLSAEFTIPLTESPEPSQSQSLTVRFRTLMLPLLDTRFNIVATGPLAFSCKPPPNPSSVEEVKSYILWATACALAGAFVDTKDENLEDGVDFMDENGEDGVDFKSDGLRGWHLTHNPTVLRKSFKNEKDSKDLAFKTVVTENREVEIRATYLFVESGDQGSGSWEQLEGGGTAKGAVKYVWRSETETSNDEVGGKQTPSLKEVVNEVGKWTGPVREAGEFGFGDGYEVISHTFRQAR